MAMKRTLLIFSLFILKFEIISYTRYPLKECRLHGVYFLRIVFVFFKGHRVRILASINIVQPKIPGALKLPFGRFFVGKANIQSMCGRHPVCIAATILVYHHTVQYIFACRECNCVSGSVYECT